MNHRLYGLRGKAYTKRYKEIFESDRTNILAAFDSICQASGKFTPRNLGELCLQFNLPVKVMDEFLPDITNHRYSSGTWERLQEKGCKVKDICPPIQYYGE